MIRCESCGSKLPVNSLYCGNCGRKIDDRFATLTDISNTLQTSIHEPQTPPLFSSPMHPDIHDSGMEWQDTASTFQTKWDIEDMEGTNRPFNHRITDENDAVFPDVLLPGMLALRGQLPSPSQAPMVEGTPQFGGVPSVQGTPSIPGNVPQSMPGPAQGVAPAAPSNAPMEAQNIPIHHQQVQQPAYQPPAHFYNPVYHPQPTPPPHQPVHHSQPISPLHKVEHKHHHTGPLHEHKLQSSKLQHTAAASSKAGAGVVSKWLIIIIVSLVVIGSGSVLLAHALMPTTPPPTLSITGSNVVRDGDVMHIHGQGFHSGDGVALTIDNGLSVFLAGQHSVQTTSNGIVRNVPVTGLSQMNIAGMVQFHSSVRSSITVSSTGTFDANITVPSNLPAGQHTLHATDNQSLQSAILPFTVSSSQLAVNPTALNFGSVEVGRTVKLLITLNNVGGASLHWTAAVEGSNTNWLKLSKNSDVLGSNGANETVIVTANTSGLSVGSRNATVRFHSDNGDVLIAVSIHVVSIGQVGQQAILNVSQQSLDFGQLQVGQPAQKNVSIANLGNLPLQWQASTDAASAKWLSLAASKGSVQPGAVPQQVQVNVDTNGLAAGSYSGTVNITSNGGNAQVKVTLVVKNTPRIPTVTGINPTNGPGTGGTSVTITGTGFTGATNVSFGKTPASNITVVNDTQINATSPAGSGTVDVTITTPSGTSTTSSSDQFTYTVVPPPTPTITAIKPSSGPVAGGTTVTITGTGFTGATNVSFGQTPASNVSVKSDTQITATSPAGNGTVDITVTTSSGTSATSSVDQFTYIAALPPAPTVTGINPTSGPGTGGTSVTITGTGFTNATSVAFGSAPASNVKVVSDTQITATSPAGSGTVDVIVTTPIGTSATSSSDQFTYTVVPPPTPTVTAIKPSSGPVTGGTTVTITGTGFTNATSVSFGRTAASNFNVVSDTLITATSPAGSGTVDITVTAPGGTSVTGAADQFTYTTPSPTVTGLKPNSGYTTGGTGVTIVGTNFTGASSVTFGQTAASNFSVVSDTQITVTSPAGSGAVDVTVTTSSGTSATSSADQFTYMTPPPTITSISPQGGYTTGGTIVTITGTGFTGATSVSFGQTSTSSFKVISDTQITVTSPAVNSTGTVDITITTSGGTSTTGTADQFTYSSPLS